MCNAEVCHSKTFRVCFTLKKNHFQSVSDPLKVLYATNLSALGRHTRPTFWLLPVSVRAHAHHRRECSRHVSIICFGITGRALWEAPCHKHDHPISELSLWVEGFSVLATGFSSLLFSLVFLFGGGKFFVFGLVLFTLERALPHAPRWQSSLVPHN